MFSVRFESRGTEGGPSGFGNLILILLVIRLAYLRYLTLTSVSELRLGIPISCG